MAYNITLIPGDGIGPEVAYAAKKVLDSIGLDINWDIVNAGEKVLEETGTLVPDSVYASIEKNKIAIKGPITTPIGKGFRSINVQLRKKYDLYTNIRPIKSLDDSNIDMVIFRENTEGLYIGEEEMISPGVAHAIKRITKTGSERIIRKAFEYAIKNNINIVTVAHKANILKITDGLFLDTARELSKEYKVEINEVIIDAMCMQMVMNPSQFGVIVTTNLYGDILSDLGAGLVGGLGLIPGANIGTDIAIFEAVHGSAPDIAGKNMANPIAMIRSAIMMLEYIGENQKAQKLDTVINYIILENKIVTKDLGGSATTNELVDYIIKKYTGLLDE